MPSKYVPPQLRNEGTSMNDSNTATSNPQDDGRTQRSAGYENYDRNGGRGGYSYSRNSRNSRRNDQNFNNTNRTPRFQTNYSDPVVISYAEKQKKRGIDIFEKQKEIETRAKEGKSDSNFSSWDARSIGTKLSPLGFNGSVAPDSEIEKQYYSQISNTGINFDKYDSIPVEVSGDGAPGPLESFNSEEAETMLPHRLMMNLKLCGFNKPTPVQKHSIPIGLADRDLMACAQTGSGKTGGFLFPIISLLLRKGAMVVEGGPRGRVARPNALILGPTRELVVQIFEEAQKFCYATGIRPVVCYGGAKSYEQKSELLRGCDICVATPGRLQDFLQRGVIELCCVQQLVLDEADRMLDMGFEPSIRQIVHETDMPRTEDRRTFLFSATFPREIQSLASDFMRDYIFLTVGRVGSAANDITQTLQYVSEREKRDALISILNGIKNGLVLVFVQTKRNAEDLQYYLFNQGFPTASIHGDRTQFEREEALSSFKSGETPILVATDVAARGLDIDNVTFVINFDLPGNIDDYVHRIGRTGRAGNKGNALSFFNEKNSNIAAKLVALLKDSDQEIPSFLKSYSNSGRGSHSSYRNNNTRDFRGSRQSSYNQGSRGRSNNNVSRRQQQGQSSQNRNNAGGNRFNGNRGQKSNNATSNDAW